MSPDDIEAVRGRIAEVRKANAAAADQPSTLKAEFRSVVTLSRLALIDLPGALDALAAADRSAVLAAAENNALKELLTDVQQGSVKANMLNRALTAALVALIEGKGESELLTRFERALTLMSGPISL